MSATTYLVVAQPHRGKARIWITDLEQAQSALADFPAYMHGDFLADGIATADDLIAFAEYDMQYADVVEIPFELPDRATLEQTLDAVNGPRAAVHKAAARYYGGRWCDDLDDLYEDSNE